MTYRVGMDESNGVPEHFTTVPTLKDAVRLVQRYIKGAADRIGALCPDSCGACNPCKAAHRLYESHGTGQSALTDLELRCHGQSEFTFGALHILAVSDVR